MSIPVSTSGQPVLIKEEAEVLVEHQTDDGQFEVVEVMNPGDKVAEEYVEVPSESELLALESGEHNLIVG